MGYSAEQRQFTAAAGMSGLEDESGESMQLDSSESGQ